jgi:nucleotide-binding universal stress UspA family protein
MAKPIVVGYDPRERDRAPVDFGLAAAELTGATLVLASVEARAAVRSGLPGGTVLPSDAPDPDLVPDSTAAIQQIEPELTEVAVPCESLKLQSTSAARALHEAAETRDAGLLVVGSSRRSAVGRVLTGSTAERLLHGAPCPVAVVPHGWQRSGGLNRIAVAYVDSDEGREALRSALALARRTEAKLRAISAIRVTANMLAETETYVAGQSATDLSDVEGAHRLEAERALRDAITELGAGDEVEADAVVADPAQALIDASRQVDLLVCGSRGYGPMRGVLLGSVSRRVVREAHCPVVLLPRGVTASLDALVGDTPGATASAGG